jgi:hypothetical protein|tara:strand:- start:308 stop:523 length:216 start_codon:yes stop_codon:yes gene_type:complete
MTVITINDKEYDYDSLTETQVSIITEISACDAEIKRSTYASNVYNARHSVLMEHLLKSLEDVDDDQAELDV